jgi:hypothetical protein
MAVAAEETFVGREICASCHQAEAALWQGSDHDKAMQEATESTVLGDFDNASMTHFGVTSTFFRKDGAFFVRTEGPDGSLEQYQIAYTFGFYPLQQYLVAFPGGRYQALPLAWDSRLAAEGGQRWFHLYPNDPVPSTDPLHWTGRNQNWNFMCADCHSTNLRKNFDLATNQYKTQWSEIDVSCEASRAGIAPRRLGAFAGGGPDRSREGTAAHLRGSGNGRWRLTGDRHCQRPRHASRPPNWRPARAVIRAGSRSPRATPTGTLLDARTGRSCWMPGSIMQTARSSTRSTNTARSGRAACSRWA